MDDKVDIICYLTDCGWVFPTGQELMARNNFSGNRCSFSLRVFGATQGP